MFDSDELRRLTDFIQEPMFVLARSGRIEWVNMAARGLLGDSLVGRRLADYTPMAREEVNAYLHECAGSSGPVIGAMTLITRSGREERRQVKGARLGRNNRTGDVRIVLRCGGKAGHEFSLLARRVDELNRDNRRQRLARATLQELLEQRELLLREVQHRVRNITQMMLGMVSMADRAASSPDLSAFLGSLRRRLTALGTVQQLMYTSAGFASLSARNMLETLCESTAAAWPSEARLTVDSVDVALDNDIAVPLALILNELLSNALKHGLKFGRGTVEVGLDEGEGELVLRVSDSGPGFAPGTEELRSSGLNIVRGLCRQIGGALAVSEGPGARCTVRFAR